MKKPRRENLQYVNTGDPLGRAPAMERWNSFSIPMKQDDLYSQSDELIGELNPELEKMQI